MRRGGLALIAIVILGALAGVRTPLKQPAATSSSVPNSTALPLGGAGGSAEQVSGAPNGSFATKIQGKIRTFFAEPLQASGNCRYIQNYCVPPQAGADIRFVIAVVPDPVHSHLAHFFDEAIEAIEQGAFNEGYLFDRAIMPWPYSAPSLNSSVEGRTDTVRITQTGSAAVSTVRVIQGGSAELLSKARSAAEIPQESFPGLMIFRENESRLYTDFNNSRDSGARSDPGGSDHRASHIVAPLFVFVVGETPTAGINEDQFRYAVQIIHHIRSGMDCLKPADDPDFGILGPTFSGSLYSMRAILQNYLTEYSTGYKSRPNRFVPLYGTVLGTNTIEWFQHSIPDHVRMVLFQQDSATVLTALLQFVNGLSYGNGSVAVLSEDETAYGNPLISPSQPASKLLAVLSPKKDENKEIDLFFPRGISQFRSDYSKEISGTADDAQEANQPPTNVRLDLEITGSDDDSVAPYAKPQTSATQEAVMLGIMSELRQHEAKFVVLRATDPLDELFLAHYLHVKYPQGRIVVPTPDLLFAREGDAPLDGVLGLNTYPLTPSLPDSLNPMCAGFSGWDTFDAAHDIATYNATTGLIRRLGELSRDTTDIALSHRAPGGRDSVNGPMDWSSCTISPNLWLTMISRNAIRPIKILPVTKSTADPSVFPKTTTELAPAQAPHERDRKDARVPLWVIAYVVCVGFMFRHCWLSWTGGDFGMWMTSAQFESGNARSKESGKKFWRRYQDRKAWFLWWSGVLLAVVFAILVAVWLPVGPVSSAWWAWTPLVWFVGFAALDFWQRRQTGLGVLFVVVAAGVAAACCYYVKGAADFMVLWQQRAIDLASGASPATPVLFLIIGLYFWCRYAFRAEGLVDWRRPRLPIRLGLPYEFYGLTNTAADTICRVIHRLTTPWWVPLGGVVAVLCFAAPSIWVAPGHAPVRSLEGLLFDFLYAFLLYAAIVLLVATLLRLIAVWRAFVPILRHMDRDGMQDALRRLTGFEWNVIWNPAWSVENEGYKMMFREIQVLERLQESLGEQKSAEPSKLQRLRYSIQFIMHIRAKLINISEQPADPARSSQPLRESLARMRGGEAVATIRLMRPYQRLLKSFASTAGQLCNSYLRDYWKRSAAEDHANEANSSFKEASSSGFRLRVINPETINIDETRDADPSGLSLASLRLAEEFVASVYSNFMVTVLLGVRGLVFSAVALYACIVLSTVSYPFQPAPDLSVLAVVLFGFAGLVTWYVYEEMHRDPTLSRMTSTDPGKLDSAFWTKFASAGILPVIALITTLYPPFGHLLYTLVGPLLQALR